MGFVKLPKKSVKCIILNLGHTYTQLQGEMILDIVRTTDGVSRLGIDVQPINKRPIFVHSFEELQSIDPQKYVEGGFEYVAFFREGEVLGITASDRERSQKEREILMKYFWEQVEKLREIESGNIDIDERKSSFFRNRLLIASAAIGALTAYIKLLQIVGYL